MKVINVGRAADNDFTINDNYVSRYHCQLIHHDNGQYELIDTSTYGTYINGHKVNGKQILHQGDIVKAGNTCIPWMSYFMEQHTMAQPYEPPTSYPKSPSIPPSVNIPSEIKIIDEHSDVAKKGDDFQVSFFRNFGDKMGNTIGSTLGCLISIIIIIAFFAIIGLIMSLS